MPKGVVLMENNASYKVASTGTIRNKIFDAVIVTLRDFIHVSDLKRNLFSLYTLDSKAYKYTGECGV